MNRYVLAGVLADLCRGRRVLVVTELVSESRTMLDQLDAHATQALGTMWTPVIRRTNGDERIDLPVTGGQVRFRSARQGARGLTADVVFVDADLTIDELDDLSPVLASSGGELIRR